MGSLNSDRRSSHLGAILQDDAAEEAARSALGIVRVKVDGFVAPLTGQAEIAHVRMLLLAPPNRSWPKMASSCTR